MADADDITMLTILRHMQGMEERLTTRIVKVEQDVGGLKIEVGGLKTEVGGLRTEMVRGFATLSLQIDNLDKRLDDLEVNEMPKLKKAVGMR